MTNHKYQLIMKKGPNVGQVYPLASILITMGRDPLADIVISDPEVSRQHTRLTETDTGYEAQDLGSTNGTFVNGRRLSGQSVLLEPGQQLDMGSGVAFVYQQVPTGNEDDVTAIDIASLSPEEAAAQKEMEPEEENIWEVASLSPTEDLSALETYPLPTPARPAKETAVLPPLPPPAEPEKPVNDKRRRNIMLAAGIALLLLFCCCAVGLFMYYIGGDLILQQLELLPPP